MWLSVKKFKERDMRAYKSLITATFALGVIFVLLQALGFVALAKTGLTLQKNVSVSFLYVIVCLHALHVLGGVVALMVIFIRAFSKKVKSYNAVPIEVMSTYWHFVDILWIYLLIFLIAVN
jgi:cytochrome c oxidase subunit 3